MSIDPKGHLAAICAYDTKDNGETRVRKVLEAYEAAKSANQPVELGKLQQFKEYVHQRLDEAGIPTHPNGAHSKHGCRIGDRLDEALDSPKRESGSRDD